MAAGKGCSPVLPIYDLLYFTFPFIIIFNVFQYVEDFYINVFKQKVVKYQNILEP